MIPRPPSLDAPGVSIKLKHILMQIPNFYSQTVTRSASNLKETWMPWMTLLWLET